MLGVFPDSPLDSPLEKRPKNPPVGSAQSEKPAWTSPLMMSAVAEPGDEQDRWCGATASMVRRFSDGSWRLRPDGIASLADSRAAAATAASASGSDGPAPSTKRLC
jgi:hypothetical protein